MLTDEMLQEAAKKSNLAFVMSLEEDYCAENQYIPSLDFEKKMKKLSRRVNHPYLYPAMQRIASFILVVFLATSVWLTVDVQAREVFFGWVKETYETFFVYRFTDELDGLGGSADASEYYPDWLPDGYTEQQTIDIGGTVSVYFRNDIGQLMDFSYAQGMTDVDWFVDTTDMMQQKVNVGAYTADLFISSNDNIASVIMWTTDDDIAYFISAFLSEEDLILMAENISKK